MGRTEGLTDITVSVPESSGLKIRTWTVVV